MYFFWRISEMLCQLTFSMRCIVAASGFILSRYCHDCAESTVLCTVSYNVGLLFILNNAYGYIDFSSLNISIYLSEETTDIHTFTNIVVRSIILENHWGYTHGIRQTIIVRHTASSTNTEIHRHLRMNKCVDE